MKLINEMMSLQGRTAVITGGAGHIGASIANALAEVNASVVIIDQNQDASSQTLKELARYGGQNHSAWQCDITAEHGVGELKAKLLDSYGRLDILINCAALVGDSTLKGWAVDFENQGLEAWNRALEVNITSCFLLAKSLLPLLRANKAGSIINIASIYGVYGQKPEMYEGTDYMTPAAYAVSKGGMVQFTRYLASIIGPDVRANTISPGGVYRGHTAEFVEAYTKHTPMKRMANEDDFKGAALYFASDLSAHVTGQNLVIDGGWGL